MMYEAYDKYEQTEQLNREISRRRRKRRRKSLVKQICSLMLSAVLFGGTAGGSAYMVNNYLSKDKKSSKNVSTAAAVSSEVNVSSRENQSLDVSSIAQIGLSSVVSVTNISVQEVQNYFSRFGRGGAGGAVQLQQNTSVGSGVIIYMDEENLYMVTNYHVVEDATTLSVTLPNDETYEAELCGSDEERDLAVLKLPVSLLSSEAKDSIKVVVTGNSNEAVIGEQVVAIGNALGYGQSVTTGIISATDRAVDGDTTENIYLQTDAAINPGNSGGALFNLEGELIGINTAKVASTDVEGIGYAIPISDVLDLIGSMMNE